MSIPIALVDTTFSGKNISSAVSVYEYVATANVAIRVQVRLTGVTGSADYVAHLTLNDGDAQSDDAIGPRTTYAAADNEHSFWFATLGNLDLISGDVVNVMVLGQADDTNESGSIRIFTDDYLQPTVASRTLDVSANGEAGIDWANIGSPETVVNLTGTSVLNATEIEIATTAIQLDLDNPDQYKATVTNLDVAVSSRAATGEAATAVATLNNFDPANDQVIVGTNNDKEGYFLSITGTNDIADAVWDELKASHVIPDSFGDYLDTEVSGVGGGTPATVAAAVWNSLKASYVIPDTFGDYLDTEVSGVGGGTAAALADAVWDEVLSGHETGGTAGRAVGRLGSGAITTVSIVAQSGDVETYRGDSYLNVDGRRIEWTDASADWPTLTGTATIAVEIGGDVSFIGVIIVASGDGKEVGVELTAIQSATIPQGKLPFAVRATLTNGSVITLLEGTWTSKKKLVIGS